MSLTGEFSPWWSHMLYVRTTFILYLQFYYHTIALREFIDIGPKKSNQSKLKSLFF